MSAPLRALVCLAAVGLLRLPIAGAEGVPRAVPVIDLHVDLSFQSRYRSRPFAEGSGQYRAADLARAGVSGVVLPMYVPREVSPSGPRPEDLEGSYQDLARLLPATKPFSLPGCGCRPGRVRTWLSFEGLAPLAGHPDEVDRWIHRGVRLFGLVHTYDNALGTSSGGLATPPAATGLTDAGRELVERVFRSGALVDVSHSSDKAVTDVVAAARRFGGVVVATHSNARALAKHPRNLADADIRAIASTGGVVGVSFHSPFLVDGPGTATLDDVVRHVRHVATIGGIDHVAIGSDFEGDVRPPRALEDVRGFPALARALAARGFSDLEIEKIFARNALRVLCPRTKNRAPANPVSGSAPRW